MGINNEHFFSLQTFQAVWYKSNKNELIFCNLQVHLNAHFHLKGVRYYLCFQHPAILNEIFHAEYTAMLLSIPIQIFTWPAKIWQGEIWVSDSVADNHLSLVGHGGMRIGIYLPTLPSSPERCKQHTTPIVLKCSDLHKHWILKKGDLSDEIET